MASGSKLILVMHPSLGVTAETGVFNIKREDGVYTMLMTDGRLISAPVDDLTDVHNVKELIRAIRRKSLDNGAACGGDDGTPVSVPARHTFTESSQNEGHTRRPDEFVRQSSTPCDHGKPPHCSNSAQLSLF